MKAMLLVLILLLSMAMRAFAETAVIIPDPFVSAEYDVIILDAGQGAHLTVNMQHKLTHLINRHPIGSMG